MLRIEKLNQFYGESHTLWDIDLEVVAGSCTCLLGRNGVGKTTLLKSIMGLLASRSAAMTLAGTSLVALPAEKRALMGIGYVSQGRQIFPLLTVEENLQTGLAAKGDRGRQIPGLVFELFPVLGEMLQRKGGDLSGGQQQLAIGRALVVEPKLLILDEPTEGIQPNIVQEIGEIIRRLVTEMGLTVLLVEQKLHFVRKCADRFLILDRGRLMARGEMAGLGDDLVQKYLTV